MLTDLEFLRFVTRTRRNKTTVAGHKLDEFSKIIDEIRRRHESRQINFGYASARSSIFQLDGSASGHGHLCEVLALSPSHGDTLEFLTIIAAGMPRTKQTKRVVPSPSPNLASIATLISIGPLAILLGADVENSGKPTAGWEAILGAHHLVPIGPRASLYKVSHHGSENAHNPDIWDQLLTANPLAILTPWRKGGRRLPTTNGATRILQLSAEAFSTASDARTRRTRGSRPPGVQRFLRENKTQIRVRSLRAPFGAMRFRTVMDCPASAHAPANNRPQRCTAYKATSVCGQGSVRYIVNTHMRPLVALLFRFDLGGAPIELLPAIPKRDDVGRS